MKTYNNIAGTTSSEFSIGEGAFSVRQMVFGAVCAGADSNALDRNGNQLSVAGTEFYELKLLATDNLGNRVTKQLRGTITVGSGITKIEDTFEEGFNGAIALTLNANTVTMSCKIGSATSATYSIYIALQRIE